MNNKKSKVSVLVVAIVAVIVFIAIVGIFGGRSYEKTIDMYIAAQFEGDVETIFELVPEEIWVYMMEEEGYDVKEDNFEDFLEEGQEELEEELEDMLASLERYYGREWEVSYEILEVEDVAGDDFNDLKDDYEDADIKISSAKTVEVEFTIKGEETESSNTVDVSLIKVGRSWYLDVESMGGIF